MYLSKVSIKNFRNLKDLNINLDKGVNVIVGENNIGKSNIIEAIRLGLGYPLSSNEKVSKDDFYKNESGATTTEAIRIDLFFSELNEDEHAEFIEILNYNHDKPETSTASIHYQCIYSNKLERLSFKRWGGNRENTEAAIPEDVTQSIQATLLHALRDAVYCLAPGRQNRLGRLLSAVSTNDDKTNISKIFEDANSSLSGQPVVTKVETQLNTALEGATGPKKRQSVKIRAAEPDFEQILRSLRLVLNFDAAQKDISTHELRQNGLGYNNLLFLATVLAELEVTNEATLPIFLVEEPEAHLHPQLQTVLTKFLFEGLNKSRKRQVQTIVTTHSPTMAAYVPIDSTLVVHKNNKNEIKCFSLKDAGLENSEKKKLQRMFDVTKATLLFSRGAIFVEGVCESLLIPILADRVNKSILDNHISIVPMCGVDFGTIIKLFGEHKLQIPASIVTDGDPQVEFETGEQKGTWKEEIPKGYADDTISDCDRVKNLREEINQVKTISLNTSEVTLEYDLASAGDKNAEIMCQVWDSLSETGRSSSVLKEAEVKNVKTNKEKALLVWRGICRSSTTRSKAEFAQALSEKLSEKEEKTNTYKTKLEDFKIPSYLEDAINHVIPK